MAMYHAEFTLLAGSATIFLFLLTRKHQTENIMNMGLHMVSGTEQCQNTSKKLQTKAWNINTQGSEHGIYKEYGFPKSLLIIFTVTRCP